MGKYRLKVKGGKMPFTFMEIDTDCHAWYIHADSTEAAVRCLCDMAGELQGIDSFYVNGDDVTEKVADACLRIMHQRQQEASDIPLPEDRRFIWEEVWTCPCLLWGNQLTFRWYLRWMISKRRNQAAGPAPEKQENSMSSVSALPSDLPKLSNVMPEAMVVRHSAPAKGKVENSGDLLIGKKAIKGKITKVRDLHGEMDNVVLNGTVVSSEFRELRDNRLIFTMKFADDTNGINCKKFYDSADDAAGLVEVMEKANGMPVRVSGNVRLDKYTGGYVLNIRQMEKSSLEKMSHEDNYPEPRSGTASAH